MGVECPQDSACKGAVVSRAGSINWSTLNKSAKSIEERGGNCSSRKAIVGSLNSLFVETAVTFSGGIAEFLHNRDIPSAIATFFEGSEGPLLLLTQEVFSAPEM
jgi:hypothetical protein